MKPFEPDQAPAEPLAVIVQRWFGPLAALAGLAMMLVGLYFAFQLFAAAYAAVTAPEPFGRVVDQWTEFLSGDGPLLDVADEVHVSPRLLTVAVLAGCTLVLLWLTLAVISTGAKIVYWMASDHDAVKRVLSHVFGPSVIKVVKGPEEPPPERLGSRPREADD